MAIDSVSAGKVSVTKYCQAEVRLAARVAVPALGEEQKVVLLKEPI